MSKTTKSCTPIATIRRARLQLRKNGLNHSEIQMLEEIAVQMHRQKLRVLRGSYLARALGITRQWANALLRRLAQLGLIFRFKTGLIRLNTEKLNKIAPTTVKRIRRKTSKWLKTLIKSRRGNNHVPKIEKPLNSEATEPRMDRQTALAELRACYIPPHLRKFA